MEKSISRKELISKFHEKGYKVTPQRLKICEFVLSSKDHPTAEEIYHEVIKNNPTISLATVYKTLHLLSDLGLVQELNFAENRSRFDPNISPHINIICPKCGKILDYESKNIKQLWDMIISELKIKPSGQRMDLYVECEKWDKIQS